MTIKPLSPQEAKENLAIPDFVIEAVNDLIKENFNGNGSFNLLQKDIEERISSKTQATIVPNWISKVQQIYKSEGWNVEYDAPGYCETYKAYLRFSPKRI
ncbi:hypothetical protein [Acinetobacter sp.]|uniref:hypothetical protein n=1 Tax=Acinetobacter sp. TaxID=472 RepID=UPI00388EA4BA